LIEGGRLAPTVSTRNSESEPRAVLAVAYVGNDRCHFRQRPLSVLITVAFDAEVDLGVSI
jgi:hypothetical protein